MTARPVKLFDIPVISCPAIQSLPASDPSLFWFPLNYYQLTFFSGNPPHLVLTQFASDYSLALLTSWHTDLPSAPYQVVSPGPGPEQKTKYCLFPGWSC